MDFTQDKENYNDEEDLLKEDEAQKKEIQALLIKEFENIIIDDEDDEEDDDEDENNYQGKSDNSSDDNNEEDSDEHSDEHSKFEQSNNSIDSNEKENFLVSTKFMYNKQLNNWNGNMIQGFYPNDFMHPQILQNNSEYLQTNNNFMSDAENSKTWEISLHNEMGIPLLNNQLEENSRKPPINKKKVKCNLEILKPIKRDVAVECVPINQRELDNLELLYEARGKRIEQLQSDFENEREHRLKDTRILRHQLTLLEGEKRNLISKQDQIISSRDELNERIVSNEERLRDQDHKLTSMSDEIERLQLTLRARDSVIETLNEQLSDMKLNTNINKHNQQQEDLLDSISRQHSNESYRLKLELRHLNERMDEKVEAFDKLQDQIDEQTRQHNRERNEWRHEQEKFEKDILQQRQLVIELENSCNQARICELEETVSHMRTDKLITKDMVDFLQNEVDELSQQLLDYEKSMSVIGEHDLRSTQVASKGSLPDLTMGNEAHFIGSGDDNNNCYSLVSTAMLRNASLTNRLLEVRKINLDLKTENNKISEIIEERSKSIVVLEKQVHDLTKRLQQLDEGIETDKEKHLNETVTSLEVVKLSLDEQCKMLQTQLSQTKCSLVEVTEELQKWKCNYDELEIKSEQEKEIAIMDVKAVCDKHYDNLRYQLELNWNEQKQVIIEEEARKRHIIEKDLKEAANEVDRVKNLYIDLCHEKSNDQMDQESWNGWLKTKLEEQKKSLNQQFKNDKQLLMKQLEAQHAFEIETLKKEIESFNRHNTVINQLSQTEMSHKSHVMESKMTQVQIAGINIGSQTTQTPFDKSGHNPHTALLQESDSWKKYLESVLNQNKLLNEENKLLKQDIEQKCHTNKSTTYDYCSDNLPNIIRSSTPNLIHSTNRSHQPLKQPDLMNDPSMQHQRFSQQFQNLKTDLINQLSNISNSMEKMKTKAHPTGNRLSCDSANHFSSDENNSSVVFNRIQQHMKTWLLDVQSRAATTIQNELKYCQIIVRRSLTNQLLQMLPVYLAVEAQLIQIDSNKIQMLSNKLCILLRQVIDSSAPLTWDQLQSSSNRQELAKEFLMTSTPKPSLAFRNQQFSTDTNNMFMSSHNYGKSRNDNDSIKQSDFDAISDITIHSISSLGSVNNCDKNPTMNHCMVADEFQRLTKEIEELSQQLHQSSSPNKNSSHTPQSTLFSYVDDNLLNSPPY